MPAASGSVDAMNEVERELTSGSQYSNYRLWDVAQVASRACRQSSALGLGLTSRSLCLPMATGSLC
jgi:hypothetical protein